MGNLLRALANKDDSSKTDVFVDFENALPTEVEKPVYDIVAEVLKKSDGILEELMTYKGASDEIREAIANPRNDELQKVACMSLKPLVLQLKRYFEFSTEMESVVPQILGVLCGPGMSCQEHLESQQALFKQFAELIQFTFRFDDLKMTMPAIQNDFSFYRRTLSRMKMANEDEIESEVGNEMANRMSLFYAYPTPMLKVLSETTCKFVSENKSIPVENTTECLSTMANICRAMIENPKFMNRFQNRDTLLFCLRVMVGVIILYDHVHPVGAFSRTSSIDIKASIKLLKDQSANGEVDGLMNALRYTSKHLNDENTPRNIRILLRES